MMRLYYKRSFGFTLMELMIAVAIIGILASVAYPSYVEYVTRSNRSEGQRELLRIANLMEQRFIDTRAYTNDMTDLGLNADPFITVDGGSHYSIDAINVVNATFTLQATAIGGQATKDAACSPLTINEAGQRGPSADCWEQ